MSRCDTQIERGGFDALFTEPLPVIGGLEPAHNSAFNSYIAIHKVFVGRSGAAHLVSLCMELQDTTTPDHLVASGWAAAEAAIVTGRADLEAGHGLLETARDSWTRAIAHQRWVNAQPDHPLVDQAVTFRAAHDIAFLPVYHDMLEGGVRKRTLKRVFEDCLNIAQLNGVQANLARANGDTEAVGQHNGFGYEANAVLAYNRRFSGQWFAIPASSRADSGVYHRNQTHDIVVVRQERGRIASATPIEIKAAASRRQRGRYASLLVRGKMHLADPSRHHPDEVLEAITAEYEGTATRAQREFVAKVNRKIHRMVGDYLDGEPRHDVGSPRGVVVFRDRSRVAQRHEGLAVD